MTPVSRLEEIAKTRNWIAFGKALAAAMEAPIVHGYSDPGQLLARVAQLRGVDPSSLRNPLAAVNWMKLNAPEALEGANPKFPMTGVLTLSQIAILSSDLAESLSPKFFSGALTRRELQEALLNLQEGLGGKGVAAHERAKRGFLFEEEVLEFLERNPMALELGPSAQVVRNKKDTTVPCDFLVVAEGTVIAAIECKSHRNKRHRRFLVETLAMTALLAREHQQGILVIPSSWDTSTEEISRLSQVLGLENVRIAIFKQDQDPAEQFRFLVAKRQA